MADCKTNTDPGPETFNCDVCPKTYTSRKAMYRHKRTSHGQTVSFPGSAKCTETGCSFSCSKIMDLHSHIKEVHGKDPSAWILIFSTFQAFLDWKAKEESNTNVSYVQDRGKKMLHCGSTRLIYYCNRSGQYKSKGSGMKKSKKQGSCKIGMKCTSMMVVTLKTDQTVEVTYYKTHTGHSMDLEHVRISEEDRCRIAEKLAEGVSMDEILEAVRDTENHGNKLTRLQLLKRKDLHNIKKEFGLCKQDSSQPNDLNSVKPCMKSTSTVENSPILLNKPQEEPCGKVDETNFLIAIISPAQQEMLKLGLQVNKNNNNNNNNSNPRPIRPKFCPIRPACSNEATTSITVPLLRSQHETQGQRVSLMCTPDIPLEEPSVKKRLLNSDVGDPTKQDISNASKAKTCIEPAKQHIDHQYITVTRTASSEAPVKIMQKFDVGDLTDQDFSTPAKAKQNLKKLKQHVDEQCRKIRTLQKNKRRLEIRIQKLQDLLSSAKEKPAATESLVDKLELALPATAAELVKRSILKEQSRESYAPELRSFAMTLHFYSSEAYEYVRQTFNGCLPHPATIRNWYRVVDGKPVLSGETIDAETIDAETPTIADPSGDGKKGRESNLPSDNGS